MKIWIFNNYNELPSQGGLNRHYFFARQLQKLGHEPVVFVGSHPHNTHLQMIEGKESFRMEPSEPFPWVYVKTVNYEGSKLKRVFSMFQYYHHAKKAALALAKQSGAPDAVLGSSAHPLAAVLAIRLGKRFGCKSIAEVRDLWPESIVAYGIAGPRNPAVLALRRLEKWIYEKADDVVFTCEGGYDYIVEQGWEAKIPRAKVHYINNGVDLAAFEENRVRYTVQDPDLEDPSVFKVVYVGSIRQVNHLGLLLDAAKEVTDPRVKFLIWGDGDQRAALEQRVRKEGISNVVFKGKVEKTYIPGIVSRADINLIHGGDQGKELFRFGISPNKMFDCFAAGRPILMDLPAKYNPVEQFQAGICLSNASEIPAAIRQIQELSPQAYESLCSNARKAAARFDFRVLTQDLMEILEKRG